MERFAGTRAADLVSHLVDLIGVEDRTGVLPLLREWTRIVGDGPAAHSRIIDIANGAVMVGVDHPAWLQRLQLKQDRILMEINRRTTGLTIARLQLIVVDDLASVPQAAEKARAAHERAAGRSDPEQRHADTPQNRADTATAPESTAATEQNDGPAATRDAFNDLLGRLRQAIERRHRD